MEKVIISSIMVWSLMTTHLVSGQKFFGIFAQNNSKNFQIIDYVLEGKVKQEGLKTTHLSVPVYSLHLLPGASEEVGVGYYSTDPSNTNPLTINSSDSTYIILKNLSNARDSVSITLRIGETGEMNSKQTVLIEPGKTSTIHLMANENVFRAPLLPNNSSHYSGITLSIQ